MFLRHTLAIEQAVSCTAVRVPTLRAHAAAITLEFEKDVTAEGAR
jgi:aspartate-semialdehyde dehydrogenase